MSKRFGARAVLTSASLRAVPGTWTALMGRNGAGKSTLLRIAAGMIPADSGSVRWAGEYVADPHPAELARKGMFFLADRDLLSPRYSVRRQLGFFRERFAGPAIEVAAAAMGVEALLDRKPHQLSGGERRRAELAAALVRDPTCLLADEPYRGVSPIDAEALTRTFRALAAGGCAVVVTGHETTTFLAAVDRVTWCDSGTTIELGTPTEAMSTDRFMRGYLGTR